MTAPLGPVLPVPQPAVGPTPRLQWNDPATIIMLFTWLGEAAKAIADATAGHTGPAGIMSAAATTLVTVSVLVAKHVQAGQIAAAQLGRIPNLAPPL